MKWVACTLAAILALPALAPHDALAQGVLVERSEIRFVSKQMGVNVEGRFRKWTANVVFLPDQLERSKADFTIELASIDLASEESEGEVRGPLWFDAAKFPVARFVSTSIRSVGPDRYEVAGRLSIKGTTRELAVPITYKRDASGGGVVEGSFVVKRLDFRIGEGLWADTGTVADEVNVRTKMVLAPPR